MSVIFKGALNPFLQEEKWIFDPQRGTIYRRIFRGASQALMQSLYASYVLGGIACELTYNQGDTATLDIDDSTLVNLIDNWQIVGNTESRDVFGHPSLEAWCDSHSLDYFKILKQLRESLSNEEDPTVLFGTGGAMSGAPAVAQELYRLALRGSTEYRHAQYVLRHETNVPNRWDSNISDFGIEEIYTTNQLLVEVQDASLWVYPLPGRLAYKINAIPAPVARANHRWGWLKDASTETTGPNNRVVITTEYILEQWSTTLYTPH